MFLACKRPDQQEEATLHAEPASEFPEADKGDTIESKQGDKEEKRGKKQKKGVSSTAPLPYKKRRAGLPLPLLILVIALVTLLIVGGFGLIIFAETTQYRTTLHGATVTANNATHSVQQTAQAEQNGTMQALETAQANIEASATAEDNQQAQATITADDATSTALALNDFYTQSTNGNPVFDDPLSDNTGAGKWDEGTPSTGTACEFTDNSYHALESQDGYLQPCLAQSTRFSNFAYQVHVTIEKDSQGSAGLLFRVGNNDTAYYFFRISPDGSYALDLYSEQDQGQTLAQGASSAILPGLGQDNLITAIANSTSLSLYANGQYLAMVTESKLSAGKIGLGVISKNGAIDAMFSEAQVWQLSQEQTTRDSSTPDASATASATSIPGMDSTPGIAP